MKIFYNNLLPVGKKFSAINLFGCLFVKEGVRLDPILMNHERIHSAQMKELLWIPFYLLYIAEWLIKLVKWRGDSYRAYKDLSFEKEAYENENNLQYLPNRTLFAHWKRGIAKKRDSKT